MSDRNDTIESPVEIIGMDQLEDRTVDVDADKEDDTDEESHSDFTILREILDRSCHRSQDRLW